MSTRPVTVHSTGEGRYVQAIECGPHRLIADEDRNAGGNDRGPDPYGFLMAGLGACTSMTLRMYADMKGLPLTGVDVELTHEKIEVNGEKRDRFTREIVLHGPALTRGDREKLIEIANKCPVHRTLSSQVIIETTDVTP